MGFVPPLNLGGFQPSPATLAQWVYQIWQYLQENPIATDEQLKEYIGTFITTSPETQAMIGAGVEEYLTENPPTAPVQSVQGKTGAVQLAYNEIVPASNAVPVYKAASTPSANTLTGQYNLGYRLFVNTASHEIFTISPAGALSLVGRGVFDGTSIDLNSAQGDTTIAEAVNELNDDMTVVTQSINTLNDNITDLQDVFLPSTGTNVNADAFGWVTNAGNNLIIGVPLNKSIPSDKNITLSYLRISMRTIGGGYAPANGYEVPLSSELLSIEKTTIGLRITLARQSGGWGTTATNNTPLTGPIVFSYTLS